MISDDKDLMEDLTDLINRHSLENDSNTPDFILAEFILGCLKSYADAINKRDKWYGFDPISSIFEDGDD